MIFINNIYGMDIDIDIYKETLHYGLLSMSFPSLCVSY